MSLFDQQVLLVSEGSLEKSHFLEEPNPITFSIAIFNMMLVSLESHYTEGWTSSPTHLGTSTNFIGEI